MGHETVMTDIFGPAVAQTLGGRRVRCYVASMTGFLSHLALPIALLAVTFVLLLGLINMMRGGSPNTSQRLMRLRVLFQFIAVVIAMAAIWAMGK